MDPTPDSIPSTERASCRSILTLDKSSAPFEEQISEACNILHVKLEFPWATVAESHDLCQTEIIEFDPRHEWTLKWLLKKLRTAIYPGSPCLLPSAWTLFRFLIAHTHPAKVARLLTSSRFTEILRNVLDWLDRSIGEVIPSSSTEPSSDDGSEVLRIMKENPKKRKRETSKHFMHKEAMVDIDSASMLLASICGSFRRLQALMTHSSVQGDPIVAEHLQHSMRSSPDEAATILGSCCSLLNQFVQKGRPVRQANGEYTATTLSSVDIRSCAQPLINLWEMQGLNHGAEMDVSISNTFIKQCLLPSLLLLQTCYDTLEQTEATKAIARRLEVLIAKNVVSPLRVSFHAAAEVAVSEDNDLFTLVSQSFARALQASSLPQLSRRDWKTKTFLTASKISLFFDVAVMFCSRATPKARREEDLFLRKLFDELKKSAELILQPTSSRSTQKVYCRALRCLLERTVHHGIQLKVSTIQSILEQTSGLFGKNDSREVEWTVISLCLKNNPDVFVVPLRENSDCWPYQYRTPSKYLSSLLATLPTYEARTPAKDIQLYDFKLDSITIPLLRAFADVRDLSGFLEHWREQLDKGHERRRRQATADTTPDTHQRLWEDDDLMQAASRLIVPSLSANQIDAVIVKIESELCSLEPKEVESFSVSTLVILDCVFAGCSGDDLLVSLSSRARSIYDALAKATLSQPASYAGHRWRFWRVLATINWKWPVCEDGYASREVDRVMAQKAMSALDDPTPESAIDLAPTFQEKSHAFGLLTSLTLLDRIWPGREFYESENVISKAVGTILDLKEFFCRQLDGDKYGVMKPLGKLEEWSGRGPKIQSLDTLHVSCFAQLLSSPTTISHLDTHKQRRMLEQLNRLAVYQKRYTSDVSYSGIGYERLWKRTLCCEAVSEDMAFSRILRHLQCTRFLAAFGSEDHRYWNINTVEYAMAIEDIQAVASAVDFNSEDRIDVANRLLDVLLFKEKIGLKRTAQHLQLLTKFADAPNKSIKVRDPEARGVNTKSMKVFQNIEATNHSMVNQSALFILAEKIISEDWSVWRLPCEEALCALTRIVLRHTYATLTLESSMRYFVTLYQWLGNELEHSQQSSVNTSSHPSWTCDSIMLRMTTVALNHYHENRAQVKETIGPVARTLDNIRQQHFERVVGLSKNFSDDGEIAKNRHVCAVIKDCLHKYLDLMAGNHAAFLELVPEYEASLKVTGEPPRSGYPAFIGYHGKLIGDHQSMTELAPLDQSLFKGSLGILAGLESVPKGREKDNVWRHFQDSIQAQGPGTVKEVLTSLDPKALLILCATLAAVNGGQANELRAEISDVYLRLCQNIVVFAVGFRESMLSMQCVALILQNKSQIVSQHQFDTLLFTITTSAANLSPKPSPSRTAKLYLGLCRIFATALTLHRPKLGGRYHLILPALQNLLQQLFTPYATVSNSASFPSAFSKEHAGAFSRLLTSLCDPSPSAVSRRGHRQKATLNDETKRAKSIAGQHLHYLIMTYCECQLKGRLAEEGMKEALEPGLWAVLECTGQEVTRTMNSSMDDSGRAVWKRLYEDWKKFGQWKGG